MITKKDFDDILTVAAQPLTASSRKKPRRRGAGYNGKRTHRRKTVNTSGKRHDKSR